MGLGLWLQRERARVGEFSTKQGKNEKPNSIWRRKDWIEPKVPPNRLWHLKLLCLYSLFSFSRFGFFLFPQWQIQIFYTWYEPPKPNRLNFVLFCFVFNILFVHLLCLIWENTLLLCSHWSNSAYIESLIAILVFSETGFVTKICSLEKCSLCDWAAARQP